MRRGERGKSPHVWVSAAQGSGEEKHRNKNESCCCPTWLKTQNPGWLAGCTLLLPGRHKHSQDVWLYLDPTWPGCIIALVEDFYNYGADKLTAGWYDCWVVLTSRLAQHSNTAASASMPLTTLIPTFLLLPQSLIQGPDVICWVWHCGSQGALHHRTAIFSSDYWAIIIYHITYSWIQKTVISMTCPS